MPEAELSLDEPWALSPSVALRPEPFGALAYHFGNRKLIFLKRLELVTVKTDDLTVASGARLATFTLRRHFYLPGRRRSRPCRQPYGALIGGWIGNGGKSHLFIPVGMKQIVRVHVPNSM